MQNILLFNLLLLLSIISISTSTNVAYNGIMAKKSSSDNSNVLPFDNGNPANNILNGLQGFPNTKGDTGSTIIKVIQVLQLIKVIQVLQLIKVIQVLQLIKIQKLNKVLLALRAQR